MRFWRRSWVRCRRRFGGASPFGRRGRPDGGQAGFFCRDCRKEARGVQGLPQPRGPFPCPYCPGKCVRCGASRNGGQRFRCRVCGRINTLLRKNPAVASPEPLPLRHKVTFCLGGRGWANLEGYCADRSMNLSQGIRDLLRPHAYPAWLARERVRDAFGEICYRPVPRERLPKLRYSETPLPNVSASTTTARWRRREAEELLRLPCTANVERIVHVQLDDEAWEGLHRLMREQGRSHQEVMRALLAALPPPPRRYSEW